MVSFEGRFNLKQCVALRQTWEILPGIRFKEHSLYVLRGKRVIRHRICTELTQLCHKERDFARFTALVGTYGQHIVRRTHS